MIDMVSVSVQMTAVDMWKLESIAERRGMTLADFLFRSALAVCGAGAPVGAESIVIFHRAGMKVSEIARRLDMTNLAVKDRLHRLGLKPNSNTKRKETRK
ncbi:hypothetical protein E3T43_07440 [Cryobacterium sp. Hh7]|uniref:hypothetical protein n=1 Tax=Cryobacterium sp. Hh7 TaxID=1259159 RepID=UPI00106A7EB5|nr:hypothetical protein [Cryobacterium sp. Hh7]TFD58071.1 hypothetical protein E3T43_07440 [Cryobacterium sp. Hh7]